MSKQGEYKSSAVEQSRFLDIVAPIQQAALEAVCSALVSPPPSFNIADFGRFASDRLLFVLFAGCVYDGFVFAARTVATPLVLLQKRFKPSEKRSPTFPFASHTAICPTTTGPSCFRACSSQRPICLRNLPTPHTQQTLHTYHPRACREFSPSPALHRFTRKFSRPIRCILGFARPLLIGRAKRRS